MFAVIAENDESQWSDETGILYHFPKRYAAMLKPQTRVIYYKGKLRSPRHAVGRLSPAPHYFGVAQIDGVYKDKDSKKGDLFATIAEFNRFTHPILAKTKAGRYIEQIPPNRQSNYWRDGIRSIDQTVYEAIVSTAVLPTARVEENMEIRGSEIQLQTELESGLEGNPKLRYVTTYERNPRLRLQALAIHGYRCKACELDMGERYGPYGSGLIHVHHVTPVSTYEAPRKISPDTDLVPVCPNCHAVIHRNKTKTLSIEELRTLLLASSHQS